MKRIVSISVVSTIWGLLIFLLVEDKKIKSLDHILETRKKVKNEIAQLKQKLQQTRDKIAEYKELAAANNPQQ